MEEGEPGWYFAGARIAAIKFGAKKILWPECCLMSPLIPVAFRTLISLQKKRAIGFCPKPFEMKIRCGESDYTAFEKRFLMLAAM
jgi:hypothetical protein